MEKLMWQGPSAREPNVTDASGISTPASERLSHPSCYPFSFLPWRNSPMFSVSRENHFKAMTKNLQMSLKILSDLQAPKLDYFCFRNTLRIHRHQDHIQSIVFFSTCSRTDETWMAWVTEPWLGPESSEEKTDTQTYVQQSWDPMGFC